jgi:hypothetical protein
MPAATISLMLFLKIFEAPAARIDLVGVPNLYEVPLDVWLM